jgi:adenosylmethionine-8-amino-7-oxononanoate aminotransferase
MCRPDLLVLGKALSGGVMPVSAVLADDQVIFWRMDEESSGEIISKHHKHSVANANRLNIRPHN